MAAAGAAVQGCCSDVVNVVTTSQIDIECKDLGRKAPLLLTELVVAPEGASFTYSTPIDSMHSKIIAVFDRAIAKLQVSWLLFAAVLPEHMFVLVGTMPRHLRPIMLHVQLSVLTCSCICIAPDVPGHQLAADCLVTYAACCWLLLHRV